ncbi:unnamed protein product [Dicrocoelium dendriticum]|nr:unnamed protein product [Dicrocoelium dendriticum]
MSDSADTEPLVHRPRPGVISLSLLIEFICQKVYTDLMRFVDLLPTKTDLEKKIEIATFFSRTRHLFVRLEALVKWSNSASKVDKCEKISNFLEEQSFFLINTANSLSRLLRETLIGARLPPFAVLLAIDIFTNKTYTRLPKSIKNCVTHTEPMSNSDVNQALLDLNRVIQNRLSLTQIPRQFKTIKLANGRVLFVVPGEFQVTVTLMSEAIDFPWRILEIKFLIKDPVTNNRNLVNPLQVQFIQNQAQSRLLHRQFDKRPPLIHLYDMLHAFSVSLQLDVLHEQAQRARTRRPPDQFVIEAYRPGQNLVISYWHALSVNQFQAQLNLSGKLQPTPYLLSVHLDPTDPQRPLCVSHRPELPVTESHRIGTTLRGNNLSIEKLLARTIAARAEQILQDLRQELMVLSPGPVRLADSPLCLYMPLLWPSHPQEFLQFRVDPVHGTLSVTCPFLLTPEAESILVGSPNAGQPGSTASSDGYSRGSVCAALASIESALNRPCARRVSPVLSATADQPASERSLLIVQSRSLRNLSYSDARWRSLLCQSLEHLRLCVGLMRLMKTAKALCPFWKSVRRSIPLVLTSLQASMAKDPSSWPATLARFQQSSLWPIVFVKLFPNNEYYVVCEAVPAPLSVTYRYYLLVCVVLSDHMDITVDSSGLLVSNMNPNWLGSSLQSNGTGLYLQVTHFVPIEIGSVWFHNPSSSLSILKSCINKAQVNLVKKRTSRVAELLNRIKSGRSNFTQSNTAASKLGAAAASESSLMFTQPTVPSLSRLLGMLEESILSHCLALELSRAGVVHDGVHYDANGYLSAIRIISLPSSPLHWQQPGIIPLSEYVSQTILRPRFDPFTYRRSWQLDLLFVGVVPPPPNDSSEQRHPLNHRLRHQLTEWCVVRLEDYTTLVNNLLAEWDSLCCMHALCYQVVENPEVHLPPGVSLVSYNLKTLSLAYCVHYLVDISYRSEFGFTIALGFSSTTTVSAASDVSTEIDSNPHLLVRQHLEELLNSTKSVTAFAKALVHTLPFVRAVEPLRDRTLSIHGLKTLSSSTGIRPVRNVVLIALSVHDLVLVYRACLSLRFTLSPPRMTTAFPFGPSTPVAQDTVLLSDAYHQLMYSNNPVSRSDIGSHSSADNLLGSLTILPAFQTFLNTLQEAFQMDIEAESWTGLTVAHLSQLLRPPRVASSKLPALRASSMSSRPMSSALSPLESYLSFSLLFHACIAALTSLDVPILSSSEQVTVPRESSPTRVTDIIHAAVFEATFVSSCLVAQVCLVPQRIGVEVATWKLALRLSSYSPPNAGPMDRWPQDTLSLLEEFFDIRVCAAPYQPSAVLAFFRILSLPLRAFRSVVRLLPLDLHPPSHSSAQLRLGLVGLGSSRRVGTHAAGHAHSPHTSIDSTGSPMQEFAPGLPGILVRPPCVTLQLLVWRPQLQSTSKYPGPPMAQPISLVYDWDSNRVAVLPSPCASQSSSNLPQLLLDSEMEANANMLASNTGDSALVQLALILTQGSSGMPPQSPYSSGAPCTTAIGQVPPKSLYS